MIRIHIHLRVLTLAVLLCAGWSSAFGQTGFTVTSVDFEGNKTFSDDRLREQVTLQSAGFIQRLLTDREPAEYAEDVFQSDLEKVKHFYQRHGFLQVAVSKGQFKVNANDEEVAVVFEVEEGSPVLVDSVTIRFTGPDSSLAASMADSIELDEDRLTLVDSVRFEDELLQEDRRLISRRMQNLGFPYVTIDPLLTVDQENSRVAIDWSVDAGPYCTFGEVTVEGNEFIDRRYIVGQLAFSEGEQYRRGKLERSQEQIYGLGSFEVVTVNARLDQPPDSVIDIAIRVSEAPRFATRFGVGYGREDDFRVFSDSRVLGFFGGIRRFNVYAKHSGLEPYHVELRFTRPAFLTPRTSAILAPFIRKQEEPGFTVSRFGGNASLQHNFSRDITSTATYTYERVELDTASVSEEELDDDQLEDLYNRSSILLGTTWDRGWPRFDPKRGFFVAGTFKISGIIFTGVSRYSKTIIDLRKYTPWQGMVLATRVELGGIVSYGTDDFVPFEDRLYSGGGSSVRGWARSELGPLDSEGQPVGGRSKLEVGLEVRYPIIGIFSGVLFTDWGNIWRDAYAYRLDELRYSAGFGLRVSTPVGKIRTDFGRPIFDDELTWQFHLSVGPAF